MKNWENNLGSLRGTKLSFFQHECGTNLEQKSHEIRDIYAVYDTFHSITLIYVPPKLWSCQIRNFILNVLNNKKACLRVVYTS